MGESGWSARSWTGALVVSAIGVGVAARLVLLALPPLFVTDVSYYNTQAVGHLFGGIDPYGAPYSVPSNLATPGASDVFAYLPGLFAFIAPFGSFWGAAPGLVLADIAIACSLSLLRPRIGPIGAAAFLLLPPVVLFSTSFLNDELPAIAFLSVALLFESRQRPLLGAVFWGLAFASSQEAWFVFPLYAAFCLRRRDTRALGASLATATAVVLPFVAWGPGPFLQDTLLFQLNRHPVPLVSQGPFGLNINPSLQGIAVSLGAAVPIEARAGALALILLLLLWRGGRTLSGLLLESAAFATLGLFMLSGDLFLSYLELPGVLVLTWWTMERGKAERRKVPPSILKEEARGAAHPS